MNTKHQFNALILKAILRKHGQGQFFPIEMRNPLFHKIYKSKMQNMYLCKMDVVLLSQDPGHPFIGVIYAHYWFCVTLRNVQ